MLRMRQMSRLIPHILRWELGLGHCPEAIANVKSRVEAAASILADRLDIVSGVGLGDHDWVGCEGGGVCRCGGAGGPPAGAAVDNCIAVELAWDTRPPSSAAGVISALMAALARNANTGGATAQLPVGGSWGF